jgi:hypothetical protein
VSQPVSAVIHNRHRASPNPIFGRPGHLDSRAVRFCIKVGDLIWISQPNRQLRVLDFVRVDEEGSQYVGLLKVEAA